MPQLDPHIAELLEQGEPARLIPVVADTSKEQRITSALLSVMMSVDEFGKSMLRTVGAPTAKTAKVSCFSEVKFRAGQELDRKLRPDGLIFVKFGSRIWLAIVEAKVGGAELREDQVEAYLDIARANKVNAVITISNQFAPRPTHYPIQVSKRKIKSVELYHCSWTSVLSEAILIVEHKGVSDPDQAFILNEFIRYLKHESSGVHPFPRLGKGWKEVCTDVQNAVPLDKNSTAVIDAVEEWHQLVRFLALQLGVSVGRNVTAHMSRAHARDAEKRLQDTIATFVEKNKLEAEFEIPDAASRLEVLADLNRRTISACMRLQAPRGKSRATALVNWLLRQLKKCDDKELLIRAIWPGRSHDTGATLWELRENPKTILNSNLSLMPVAFEVVKVLDVGARFRGARIFVEEIDALLPAFYSEVGQYLKAWVPPPPKVEKVKQREGSPSEMQPQAADGGERARVKKGHSVDYNGSA